jgi:hypothetical protein
MIPIFWERQWLFNWGYVHLAIDPCDIMVGIACGMRDVVIKPLPCVIISIETFEQSRL